MRFKFFDKLKFSNISKMFIFGLFLAALLKVFWGPIIHYFGVKDDSAVEEMIEDYIEKETDIKIDLTPGSME